MQTIVQGNRDLRMLISLMPFGSGDVFVPAAFALRRDTEDGTLLCSTLTGELVLLSPEEREAFGRLPGGASPELSGLISRRFAVPEGYREDVFAEQLRALLLKRAEAEGAVNRYNILTTTHCNARCFYCYENAIRRVHMSEETARQLTDFIADHCDGRKVYLHWFGGEPMVGRQQTDRICGELAARGIDYESEMTSNAYLFDERITEHACRVWKLKRIQVTLDGTEEVYNRTKAYAGVSDNPYRRVLRNIQCLAEHGIHVDIRLNLDTHNEEDLSGLIDELSDRFEEIDHISIYISRLDEGEGFAPLRHKEEDRERLEAQLTGLTEYLETKGWRQFKTDRLASLKASSCMADDPGAIQCTPDGILSRCEDRIYESAVGTLTDGITGREVTLAWRKRRAFNGCAGCPLYPSCYRLLEKCPVKQTKCTEYERMRRLAGYGEVMLQKYAGWKRARSADAAAETAAEAASDAPAETAADAAETALDASAESAAKAVSDAPG